MLGPSLKLNLDTRLVIARVKDGTRKTGRAEINLIFEKRVGLKHDQTMHAITFTRSAKGAATMIDHDEDACSTCNSDKIVK